MPPKQKKQPKNSYYFYMLKRKEELESEGYRFPGGFRDVAQAVGHEWAAMSPQEKAPYEELARKAKDEGKYDLSNKFTCTGESYAAIHQRKQEEQRLAEEQECYIDDLANGEGALDRVFILIKTIHCVEQIVERNQRVFWPIEMAMVAFSLREGLQSTYWTLIDTQKTPVGYASAAKECSEETGLPEPGNPAMQEYRDYNKIMKNIEAFIRFWTKHEYRRGPIVFAMDMETEHARGCLRWISNHVDEGEKKRDYKMFVESLKFYKLPKLLLRFAVYANMLDSSYVNIMVTHKLENSAADILKKGCFDYRDEITCKFHRLEKASLKMYTCCRNIVLRRMYLIFEEFLPAFGLEKLNRHDMQKLKEAQIAKEKADAARLRTAPPTALKEISVGSSWSWGKPVPRRDSRMEEEDEVSQNTITRRSTKRKNDDDDLDKDKGPPRKRESSPESYSRGRDRRTSASSSPSPPRYEASYRRLPPDAGTSSSSFAATAETAAPEFVPVDSWGRRQATTASSFGAPSVSDSFPSASLGAQAPIAEDFGWGTRRAQMVSDFGPPAEPESVPAPFGAAPLQEFVPWGNRRPTQTPNFQQDDFPTLGAAAPAPPVIRGVGRGRGAPSSATNFEEENGGNNGFDRRDKRMYY